MELTKPEFFQYLFATARRYNFNYTINNGKIYFHDKRNKSDILESYTANKKAKYLVDISISIIYDLKEIQDYISRNRFFDFQRI